MATEESSKAPGSRLLLLLALAGLSAVASAAFGRIYQGRQPAAQLALTAVTAVLLAGLLERRHILLSTLATAAGLAIAIGLLVFPETTKHGLPTLATLHAFGPTLRAVSRAAAIQPAPASPVPPLFLAGVISVWTAAFSSHTLAARARSPFLAILPPAALMAFTSLILRDGARPLYVLGFLVATLGVLFAEELRQVSQWGPVAMWHGRRQLGFRNWVSTRGARRLGMACVGIAVFTPWILPGFGHPGLVQLHGQGLPVQVSINPLVDIRPQLLQNPVADVFTVQSAEPAYWRLVALDRFDGRIWSPSGIDPSTVPLRGDGLSLLKSAPAIPPAAIRVLRQHFVIDRLGESWLPAAFDPLSFGGTKEPTQYDVGTGALVSPNGTFRGLSYDVASVAVAPTAAQLDATGTFGGLHTPFTELPTNTPAEISAIAHEVTDGEPTTYRKILAIQDYLLGPPFTYSTEVRPRAGVNPILDFLTRTHRGFCEQFAGTMAVLLRAIGIPARVAVGFTPGEFDPKHHVYRVTTREAHAWVEALFPSYGWLAFESTPGRRNPVAARYTTLPLRDEGQQCLHTFRGIDQCVPGTIRVGRGGGGTQPTPAVTHPAPAKTPGRRTTHRTGTIHRSTPVPWRTVALFAGLGALLALGVTLPLWNLLRRRLRFLRASSPGERVLAAFGGVAERAAGLGMARRRAETLGEYRARLKANVASLNGDLDLLTGLAGRAAYSDHPVTGPQADAAVASARRVAHDIRAATPPGRRLIGLYRIDRGPSLR